MMAMVGDNVEYLDYLFFRYWSDTPNNIPFYHVITGAFYVVFMFDCNGTNGGNMIFNLGDGQSHPSSVYDTFAQLRITGPYLGGPMTKYQIQFGSLWNNTPRPQINGTETVGGTNNIVKFGFDGSNVILRDVYDVDTMSLPYSDEFAIFTFAMNSQMNGSNIRRVELFEEGVLTETFRPAIVNGVTGLYSDVQKICYPLFNT